MEKFIVISRDFGRTDPKKQFKKRIIWVKEAAEAREIVERDIQGADSQDWLLSKAEYAELKKMILKAGRYVR